MNVSLRSFVLIIICGLLTGCASFEPKYREPFTVMNEIPDSDIEKTFYLIGDAGYAQAGESTPGLIAFEKYLKQHPQKGSYAIFLGDNIYPDGMPPKNAKDRAIAEHRLDVQIESVKGFDGEIIFIPGNHDWYNEGLKGLKREEQYFENKLKDKKLFQPTDGCPLVSKEISENIQLMILDSQWYLENWNEHPTMNDDCDQLKTREALFLEIEGEFKKNQNKTILFALHHPLYTNGVHGGKFEFSKHLYPSQKRIPLPVLGSLANLARTTGGVSIQDNMNTQYRNLVNRLSTLAKGAERIIFASGHEHSIQYIEHDGIKQIVSGSGSKNSYVALRNDGIFAYAAQGFVRLDILKDGSSRASYFSSENGNPSLVFQTQVYPEQIRTFDVDTLHKITDQYVYTSVYDKEGTDRTEFYEGIWGDHYRELYGTKVKAKVAMLDTLYGGLRVVRKGGGHQTRSLRLKDKKDREYNLRALKKSGVQFLQAVLFKNNYVEESLKNTISEDILKDFYTGAHPYIFTVIPDLSDAIDLYHTNPELFYIPKQPALGIYNQEYGDELYMIEERPEDGHEDLESFGKPDDIESTADLYERLRRDEKYVLDEPAYIKARLFDMLIGDWDRHQDQWRWAEYDLDNGDHLLRPIPRDRDQAFSDFDGAFLSFLRKTLSFANQFQVYGKKIEDVKWLNTSAIRLDRTFLQNSEKDEWLKQAKYIQQNLTDQVIENAFKNLPEEVQDESMQKIITNLKSRRDQLVKVANRYYKHLTSLAIVTGTDKDDYIDIERLPNGQTKIVISRIKDGKKADLVSEKIYDKKNTKEIWLYGLDDDDVFDVQGKPNNPIRIRIIGGQNNDIYKIQKGRRITVYDYKSKKSTVVNKGGARFRFTDNYDINHFNKDQKTFGSNALVPSIGFNPDDGILLGFMNTYTYNGFHRNPFTQQHQLSAGYYFATQGLKLNYRGEYAGVFGKFNFITGAYFTTPQFAVNYFGLGNDTTNPSEERDLDFDYNRVRMNSYGIHLGIAKKGRFGSFFGYEATVEGIEIEPTEDRFIVNESEFGPNSRVFDLQWFAGLNATYRYENYDVQVNPTTGMKFELKAGGKGNLEDVERTFGYVKSYLGFYNALIRSRKLVLKTAATTQFNIGRNYEFYQAARVGGQNLLRGYRNERFSGQTALAGSADLRYSFNSFKTRLMPLQIGVFGGADIGRVWYENTLDTNTWHADIGGGIWINGLNTFSGTFNLFAGEDGPRFSFNFQFKI